MKWKLFNLTLIGVFLLATTTTVFYAQIRPPRIPVIELADLVRPGQQFTISYECEEILIKIVRGDKNKISFEPADNSIRIDGIPGESITLNFQENSTNILLKPNDPFNIDVPSILEARLTGSINNISIKDAVHQPWDPLN